MTNLNKFASISLAAGLAFACLSPTLASANTAPNPYIPVGQSWINVPEASKVYFENFGRSDYDDYAIYYVAAGVTCTSSTVTAVGPFLTAEELDENNCTDVSSNPIDPINNATRAGATPFGATLNFFGTNYTSAWPNTNGGIFFNAPNNRYDRPMAELAANAQSSVMFPFGGDLYYVSNESNFWTAQTLIDGNSAVIFAWEDFHNCCNNIASEDMSFQLVLIDLGNGDFNAYFNYDSILAFNQGYRASAFFLDLETGVTVGSNTVVTDDAQFAPITCTKAEINNEDPFGTSTDSQFQEMEELWFEQENLANKTISIWSDNSCSIPISVSAVQDVVQDGYAYLEFQVASSSNYAVAAGWATYNPVNKKISWTELLRNQNSSEFINGATSPLITRSLNTTVPGRFVIGQRGGQTVTDETAVAPAAPAANAPVTVEPSTNAPAVVATKSTANLGKSIRFSTSSKVLTKSHKKALKKSVKASGKDATYVVTGTAGFLPGVTEAQVKKLAKVRANTVKAYLVKLGVNKANITIKIKTTNQGIIPKTKTLARYLTS